METCAGVEELKEPQNRHVCDVPCLCARVDPSKAVCSHQQTHKLHMKSRLSCTRSMHSRRSPTAAHSAGAAPCSVQLVLFLW